MATTVTGFRFVKCPTCKKILAEFANVPVYQCGKCGTTLRAKNYDVTRNSIIVGLPPPENDCTPKDGVQNAASLTPQSSYNLDASRNCCEKGDEVPELERSSSDERNNTNVMLQDDPDYKLQGEMVHSSNEMEKSSSKLCRQGHESMKLSEQAQDSVSSEDDRINNGNHEGHGNILQSTSSNSNPYDGSASSGDDRSDRLAHRKRIGLSRRTFRQRKVQDSADTIDEHKREGVSKMNAAATQVQAQEEDSTAIDRYDSVANELPIKNTSHARRNTSLNSDDFHSVQNWFEPENEEPVRPLSRDAELLKDSAKDQIVSPSAGHNSLEHIQMKILRKVDELREEISELFDEPDEGEGGSHLRVFQEEMPTKHLESQLVHLPLTACRQRKDVHIPSGLPHFTCMHCHHEECQTFVKTCRACCHESQIEDEPEKSHSKEKRQQTKRHCRPVLGGAPFVICSSCLQLLQLPMDFFVVRKRMYKLQCGACSKVLMFSYRARDHRIACMANEVEHSTSEVESSTDATLWQEVANSRLNDRCRSESISYSGEYGLPLGFGCSADLEPVHMEKRDGKVVIGSQLHQLMGYGSATELLYRHSDISEEFEITEPGTPHCNSPEETYLGDETKEKATCISDDPLKGIEKVDDSPKRSGTRSHGLLKIMKLKVHKNGRKNSDK